MKVLLAMKNAWNSAMIVLFAGGWRILVVPNAVEEKTQLIVTVHAEVPVKEGMNVTRFVFRSARIVRNVGVI
jgi:hypothetical protein